MKADKIYLVGFMAAGKTTVARALARRLGWEAIDVDEVIEQRERQTVADIFSRQGEAHFRALERTAPVHDASPIVRNRTSSRVPGPAYSMPFRRQTSRSCAK